MLTTRPIAAFAVFALLVLNPTSAWSASKKGGHDCVKVGKHGYKCVKGPLTGRTFPSEKAMINALRNTEDGAGKSGEAAKKTSKQKGGRGSGTS
jgi:hypothetical protein